MHALKFDTTLRAGKKLTTEQRQQRENELHQAAEFGASVLCCDEVLLMSQMQVVRCLCAVCRCVMQGILDELSKL